MLWATVNAVTVFSNIHRSWTIRSRPSTKSRWSRPKRMCRMPCTMYAPATSTQACEATISIHGCDGRAMVVQLRPSSSSTCTNTSVIVAWSPTNSMRLPASPFGPASTRRRSTRESASSRTVGSFRFRTSSGIFSTTGRRIPPKTGVRHSTSYQPGAVSVISRYAGRISCAHTTLPNDVSRTQRRRVDFIPSRNRSLRGDARELSGVRRWQGREVRHVHVLRQDDLVAGSHGLERPLTDLRALVFSPSRLDVRLHFLECRDARGRDRIDPHQMPAVAGLDRSGPRPGRRLEERVGERGAECLGHVVERPIGVVVLEHEGIGERPRSR